MDLSIYYSIARLQQDNWWYLARQRLVDGILSRGAPYESGLDLGCGVGGSFEMLQRYCRSWQGMDPSQEAVDWCRQQGYESVILGDATDLPAKSSSYDLVICLDVLEHVDDVTAVRETYRVLRPGGHLVVTVPAHQHLWNENDVSAHHLRRYERREVEALLAEFDILEVSYWNLTSYVPMLVYSTIRRLVPAKPRNNLDAVPKLLNRPLSWALGIENRLRRWLPTPTGTSVVAVARKPQDRSRVAL